jgi:nucleoside-diphosphate-sugar epimerase
LRIHCEAVSGEDPGNHGLTLKIVLPADDPRQRQPDITLAKAVLGWMPKITLDEGVERTIAYFDRMLSGTVEELKVVSA